MLTRLGPAAADRTLLHVAVRCCTLLEVSVGVCRDVKARSGVTKGARPTDKQAFFWKRSAQDKLPLFICVQLFSRNKKMN